MQLYVILVELYSVSDFWNATNNLTAASAPNEIHFIWPPFVTFVTDAIMSVLMIRRPDKLGSKM